MSRTPGAKDKVRRKYIHSFARQYLQDYNIAMYSGENRILMPVGYLYPVKLPNTRYYMGEQFVPKGETTRITKFEELKDLGFVIISININAETRWFMGQKVKYELRRIQDTGDHIGKIPKDHYIEYDSYQQVLRLVGTHSGPMNFGDWMTIERKSIEKEGSGRRPEIARILEESGQMLEKQMSVWSGASEKPKPVVIDECAFMVTDANEIICFPNAPDMPSILITGMRGSGKSFCLHSLVSRFFWKPTFDYKICVMNDSSRETGTWCLPNNDPEQINTLKRLNEKPLPLPCVYLHPLVKEEYEKLYIGEVGFDVTIPFKEIIDNHREYLNMGDSGRYFTQIIDELRDCKSEVQAKTIFDNLSLEYNIPVASANKIRAEFDTIFNSKMTDISTEGQELWRTTKNESRRYNPMTACVHAGVLPILETEFVSNYKQLLSIYFRYFVGDLFNRQKQDPDFLAEQSELLLVVDEAHNISQKSLKSGADMLMRRCVREGRPRRIGTLLATQKFNELPDVIKDNSTYMIMFKNPGEAQDIASQYNLGKHIANQIKDLGKHECIAYSTGHYIVYDSYGNKRESKLNEVFKGRTLPPYSMHKRPKDEGGE